MWTDPPAAPPMYGQSSNSTQGSSTGTRTASGKARDLLISWNSRNLDLSKMHGILVEVQQVFLPLFWPGIGYRWACNHISISYGNRAPLLGLKLCHRPTGSMVPTSSGFFFIGKVHYFKTFPFIVCYTWPSLENVQMWLLCVKKKKQL